jgi:hypothetical protein
VQKREGGVAMEGIVRHLCTTDTVPYLDKHTLLIKLCKTQYRHSKTNTKENENELCGFISVDILVVIG